MRDILITDVSGGQRDEGRVVMAANEAARLVGLDHRRGGLRIDQGSEEIEVTSPPCIEPNRSFLSNELHHRFVNLGEHTAANGDQILLAKRGQGIWFGANDGWYRAIRNESAGLQCSMTGLELRDRAYNAHALTEHETSRYHDWRGDVRYFDGGSYIETDYTPASYAAGPPETGTSVAISVWVKLADCASQKTNQVICTTDRSDGVGASMTLQMYYGKPFLECSGGSVMHNTVLTENEWHLLQVYYSYVPGPPAVQTGLMWIDGVPSADLTLVGPGSTLAHGYPLQIGGQTNVAGALEYGFEGWLGWFSFDTDFVYDDSFAAAEYAREAARYGDTPVQLPVTWRPVMADVPHGTGYYLRRRGSIEASESFFQIGTHGYFGSDDPTVNDYVMRWDSGFWLAEGKVYANNSTTLTFYASGAPLVNVTDDGHQVAAGDSIYFRVWNATDGVWLWDLAGRLIESVDQVTNAITLRDAYDTNGKGDPGSDEGDDYVEYVIVRVHKQGVRHSVGTTVASSGAGLWTLPTGTYHYMRCYGVSSTGDKGKCSDSDSIVLTSGVSNIPRISGWSACPPRYDIDRVFVYRAYEGGAFALVGTIERDYWDWLAFSTTWDDDNEAEGDAAEADAYYRDYPPALRSPVFVNDRIWGWDQADPQVLRLSSLGQYGAFAAVDLNTDLGEGLTDVGGYIQVGQSSADRGTAILPDIGAYATTGVAGDSLLLFLPRSTLRMYGIDRQDFQIQQAFEIGAASRRLAQNFAGRIVFVGMDGHVYLVPAGGSYPEVISRGLWPTGVPAALQLLDQWSLAVWDDQYVFCGPTSEGVNEEIYLCSRGSYTWRSLALGLTDILALKDTSVYSMLGSAYEVTEVSDYVFDAPIYGLGGVESDQPVEYISGGLGLERAGDEIARKKHFGYVTMCWRGAAVEMSGTVSLYESGDLSAAIATAAFSVAAGEGVRRIVKIHLKGNAVIPQLGIALTGRYPGAVDWVRIEGDVHR